MSKRMKPVIALIVPLYDPNVKPDNTLPGPGSAGGEHPDHTLPDAWPHPEHPIYWPLPPGAPIDPGWVGGVAPPGEEGGAPRPDQGLPGHQPRPDHGLPPFPDHPIVLPPDEGGWKPIYIWGPTDPRPTPPIVIPKPLPPEGENPGIEFVPIWTPETGWIVIGLPQGPHPTPSRKKR